MLCILSHNGEQGCVTQESPLGESVLWAGLWGPQLSTSRLRSSGSQPGRLPPRDIGQCLQTFLCKAGRSYWLLGYRDIAKLCTGQAPMAKNDPAPKMSIALRMGNPALRECARSTVKAQSPKQPHRSHRPVTGGHIPGFHLSPLCLKLTQVSTEEGDAAVLETYMSPLLHTGASGVACLGEGWR